MHCTWFEGLEDGVAFELYWAEFNHNDIVRGPYSWYKNIIMELCSHTYLELLRSVHNAHVIGFGNKKKKIKEFEACIEKWRPQSILDFGCGKGALLQMLREKYPT